MRALILVLMIIAVLILLLAALVGISPPAARGYNLLALGLAVWAFAELLRGV